MKGAPNPQDSIFSVLRSAALFSPVSDEDLQRLSAHATFGFARRGETIWLDGAHVDFFGVVDTGFVKMVRWNEQGTEITAELMGPKQVFGLLGVVDGAGCPRAAKAVMDCTYVKVPKGDFGPIFQQHVILKDHLLQKTAQRLRHAYDLVARMAAGRVEQRLAAILLMLRESYGREESFGVQLTVPLTRHDIGEMAGTTQETAIRILSKWTKSGMIRTDHKFVTILNENELKRVLEH